MSYGGQHEQRGRDKCHREGSKVKKGLTDARRKEQLSRMYL